MNNLKLYNLYDSILETQILKYKNLLKENKQMNIHKECMIFLESSYESINNSLNLLEQNNFVDALCLLRSSFETILFSLAIHFDKKTYDVYKFHNNDFYTKFLEEKYKKMKRKDPKFKEPKIKKGNCLKPSNIRNIVSLNYKVVFGEFFNDSKDVTDVKQELYDFYNYLCNFTHPSICKTYVFKIQNDLDSLKNLKIMFKLNIYYCKMLLLLSMNYFTEKNNIKNFLDLYGIIFLLSISQVDDVDNLKKVLKKYEDYLYMDLTRNYLKANKEEIRQLEKEIKEITDNKDMGKIIGKVMLEIIKNFESEKLLESCLNDNQ